MELNDIFTNVEVLRAALTVVALIGIAGLGVLATKKGIAEPLAAGVAWYRAHQTDITARVDEITDPLNIQLAKRTGIPAAVWAEVLPGLVMALASGLEALPLVTKTPPVEAIPQQENIASVVTAYYPPPETNK